MAGRQYLDSDKKPNSLVLGDSDSAVTDVMTQGLHLYPALSDNFLWINTPQALDPSASSKSTRIPTCKRQRPCSSMVPTVAN